MSRRSSNGLYRLVLALAVTAAASGSVAPAAAAPKEPERITKGVGPATLTAAERAKAEASGIQVPAFDAVAGPAGLTILRVERLLPRTRPADTGTQLPAFGLRDRRKPDGLRPTDAARMGARP